MKLWVVCKSRPSENTDLKKFLFSLSYCTDAVICQLLLLCVYLCVFSDLLRSPQRASGASLPPLMSRPGTEDLFVSGRDPGGYNVKRTCASATDVIPSSALNCRCGKKYSFSNLMSMRPVCFCQHLNKYRAFCGEKNLQMSQTSWLPQSVSRCSNQSCLSVNKNTGNNTTLSHTTGPV